MSVFGNRMSKQTVKRLRWTLALVGTVVLVTGFGLTTNRAPQLSAQLPASHLLADGVTYIGEDTCFTCHRDMSDSEPLQPMMIEGARESVAPVLTVVQEEGRLVEMGGATTPYLANTLDRHEPQRYLMQTGEGFTIVPGVWNRAIGTWVQQNPDGWPGECAGCHSEVLDLGVRQTIPLMRCETCPVSPLPRLIAALKRPYKTSVTTLGL